MPLAEKQLFRNLPPLTTPRLLLRKMVLQDAEDLYRYASDPFVSRYVLWSQHDSLQDSIAFVKAMVRKYDHGEVSEWCLVERQQNVMIGTCGFVSYCEEHARAEIGYALGRKYWNQGYMSEAVQAVLHYAFEKVHLNRIEARCLVANKASQRVMEKAGMSFEGILREHMSIKGEYQDLKLYSLLRREYQRLTQRAPSIAVPHATKPYSTPHS